MIFAKITRCLQCKEKPPVRQINPGEWECESCNYINFRGNKVCLKCDHRPARTKNGKEDIRSYGDPFHYASYGCDHDRKRCLEGVKEMMAIVASLDVCDGTMRVVHVSEKLEFKGLPFGLNTEGHVVASQIGKGIDIVTCSNLMRENRS